MTAPRRWAILAGLAVLAGIVGAVIVSLLFVGDSTDTAEPDLPAQTPTPAPTESALPTGTFRPPERAVLGDDVELEWVKGDAIGPTIPVELVKHEGQHVRLDAD